MIYDVIGEVMFVASVAIAALGRLRLTRSTKKTYKWVALDLDGTTLNSSHKVSPKTKSVPHYMNGKGVNFCAATGRSISSITGFIKELGLPQDPVHVVGFNGGCGVDVARSGAVKGLFECPLEINRAKDLLEFAESMGLCAQYYIGSTGDVYAVPKSDSHRDLLRRYAELTGKQQKIVESYDIPISISAPAKILIMTDDADGMIRAAERMFHVDQYHIIRGTPEPFFVEFLTPGVHKGSGLVKICALKRIEIDSVVAFGDGENDDEFLRVAGRGLAMKNARPLAMAAADMVLPVSVINVYVCVLCV